MPQTNKLDCTAVDIQIVRNVNPYKLRKIQQYFKYSWNRRSILFNLYKIPVKDTIDIHVNYPQPIP